MGADMGRTCPLDVLSVRIKSIAPEEPPLRQSIWVYLFPCCIAGWVRNDQPLERFSNLFLNHRIFPFPNESAPFEIVEECHKSRLKWNRRAVNIDVLGFQRGQQENALRVI